MSLSATYTEPELVALLQQRNEKAFSYLYDNYSGALYGIINSIVTDSETANDVLQDVFVNIWKKIESYNPSKGRLFTWMLNISRNAAIDKIRSKGFRDSLKNRPLPENVDSSIGLPVNPVINDVGLKKMIGQLREEYRTLIDLSYFQGFTHEEIAKATNIPLGTVKTRIRNALTQLRTLMQ
ncbi:MAG: sigma-70 family RNA polymerase sigma factor [Chitinophagaceae bacterium]|nr:sigma-70 family RNA polymerase sigma factor [Chitinophagaceae bacterium]